MNETSELRVAVEKGGLTILATGVVTLEAMRAIRQEIARAALGNEVARVLIDASRAMLVLGLQSWATLAAEAASEHALRVPMALLVAEPMADLAWTFCDALNKHGRIALVFTNEPDARWWVAGGRERRSVQRQPPASPSPPAKAPRRRRGRGSEGR